MRTIVPHLWFDKEAKEATELYTSLFDNSRVEAVSVIRDTPSGDCDIVSFTLAGQEFQAINAGPLFKFTPAVSFLVGCKTKDEVDTVWNRLIEDGMALMPLDSYPFSDHYGWVQDKYGVSWQIMRTDDVAQKITPMLMFVGGVCGKAEEAVNFYSTVFNGAEVGDISRYGPGQEPDKEGTVQYVDFTLEGQHFAAMDSAHEHNFAFNEAISFIVYCDTQEQIDYFWDKLSAVPESEQCGWLKDRFGLSWQIVPRAMDKMIQADDATLARVTQAFLPMKKLDLGALEDAYARR